MKIFLKNEGTTCFFNVAMQICLQNPYFIQAVSVEINSNDYDSEIYKYLQWFHQNYQSRIIIQVPQEYNLGRHMGFRKVLQKFCQVYQQNTNDPTDCCTADVKEISQFLMLVNHAIRTNTQHDVLECVDEILDVLSLPNTPRPIPLVSEQKNEQIVQQLRQNIITHSGEYMSNLWGITEKIHTCTSCNKQLRYEINPFLWIHKVRETTRATSHCEHCNTTTTRVIQTNILIPPKSIIVQVARHNDNGTKNNSEMQLNNSVTISGISYELRVVVYHEGWSFQGGHYTCAIREQQRWITNSDASASLMNESFDITKHQTTKTYAALYLANV